MKKVAGFVQKTIVFVILTCALTATGYATSFTGTITEIITSTNHPDFYEGQTVLGTYSYDSPTVDGLFGTPFYDSSASPLNFSIFLFFWADLPWYSTTSGSNPQSFAYRGMTVSNGSVSGFHLEGHTGFVDYGFGNDSFRVSSPSGPSDFGDIYRTSGTLSFSDPVSVAEPSSLILLCLGFSGLIAVKFIRGYPGFKSQN